MIPTTAIHQFACTGSLRASVILLHGYSASARVNRVDGEALLGEGIEVLLPDAPGHGTRQDGRLQRIAAFPDEQRAAAIHAVAREWLGELPSLVAHCHARGATRVGLVGISMGGFTALGALAQPCLFAAVAAVLAAPLLVDPASVTAGCPPLLLGLAGLDQSVPPAPAREFGRSYGAELHEYAESEHFMRGEDWCDLWGRTRAFLHQHLLGD